jgi:sphingomyelin phosphodiesterase acid-like 3
MRAARLLALGLLLCGGWPLHAAEKHGGEVVLLSDIHFNPFPSAQQCSSPAVRAAFSALAARDGRDWHADDFAFQKDLSPLGQDSDYPLMASALRAAHDAAPDAKAVFVTGDMLAHSFHDQFAACYPGASAVQFARFAGSTLQFVSLQIAATFPGAQILPLLGNDDSDEGDYGMPSAGFLTAAATTWQPMVQRDLHGRRADFAAFAQGGYYAAPLAGWKHLRVIALNSVLWSAKFTNGAGTLTAPGDAELQWLQGQLLAADAAKDKVVLLGHIPPGLDAYATRQARGTRIISFYRDCGELGSGKGSGCVDYAHAVPAMMQRFHATIVMAVFGHTHQNEFRVVGSGAAAIPMKIVPSISPIFQNNPAFLVVDADSGFRWTDFHAWNLLLSAGQHGWQREFDFDREYGQHAWDAASLLAVETRLRSDDALRKRFFLEMSSGNPQVAVPPRWQDAYLCGLSNLTAETVLPCVATSQLDIPLP